eukprot:860392_1
MVCDTAAPTQWYFNMEFLYYSPVAISQSQITHHYNGQTIAVNSMIQIFNAVNPIRFRVNLVMNITDVDDKITIYSINIGLKTSRIAIKSRQTSMEPLHGL